MSYKVTTIIGTDKAVANKEMRLSIWLRSNGFSFASIVGDNLLSLGETVFDIHQPLHELMQSVKNFMADQNIDVFAYKETRLVIPSAHFAWMPEHLFDSIRTRQYLKLVADVDPHLGVYHTYCPYLKSYLVFSAPSELVTAFKVALPGVDVHCQHSVLANKSMLQQSTQHPMMIMHVQESTADYELLYGGKLLLSNSYVAQDDNAKLYHAIDLMKQLHIETPDMELTICGDVNREIFMLLQQYFPNVSLYTGDPVTYESENPLPTYKYAGLLS